MFPPAGYTVWQELRTIKAKERARGYLHVMTPCIGTMNLYKTSGHWDHYRENMFPAMEMEGESYVLRPMNCPHHMMIYANHPHSYRDLPMRIGEIAHDFRYESSGTLEGALSAASLLPERRPSVLHSRKADQERGRKCVRPDLRPTRTSTSPITAAC